MFQYYPVILRVQAHTYLVWLLLSTTFANPILPLMHVMKVTFRVFSPHFRSLRWYKKSAEVRGIVQCLITYPFPYNNELSALLALRTTYFRLSASVSLIYPYVRVTYGGRLLYRLPDNILPVTVTELINSLNVQGHP
jgi:hypothetical protein